MEDGKVDEVARRGRRARLRRASRSSRSRRTRRRSRSRHRPTDASGSSPPRATSSSSTESSPRSKRTRASPDRAAALPPPTEASTAASAAAASASPDPVAAAPPPRPSDCVTGGATPRASRRESTWRPFAGRAREGASLRATSKRRFPSLRRPVAAAAVASSDRLRDAVVRNITASWQQIPHVHIGGELVADGLVAARTAPRARRADTDGHRSPRVRARPCARRRAGAERRSSPRRLGRP